MAKACRGSSGEGRGGREEVGHVGQPQARRRLRRFLGCPTECPAGLPGAGVSGQMDGHPESLGRCPFANRSGAFHSLQMCMAALVAALGMTHRHTLIS